MIRSFGAEVIVKALEDEGVDTIFTLHAFFIMDILFYLKKSQIQVVTCRNEVSAALAADGYARSSGKTGFALVNTGPSCLNTIMALKTSQKDGVPVVMLIGTDIQERRSDETFFQVVDFPKNITPHNYVLGTKDIYKDLRHFCKQAEANPISPVVIEVPLNVSKAVISWKGPSEEDAAKRETKHKTVPFLDHLVDDLKQSKKPLIAIGSGVLQAGCEGKLNSFLEKYNIPAVSTFCARGVLDEASRLYAGMPGIIGNEESNRALNECDLLLALGTRLSPRFTTKLAPQGKAIYQVNVHPADFRFDLPVIPIKCDVAAVLDCLSSRTDLPQKDTWVENASPSERLIPREWGLTSALHVLLQEIPDAILFCDDGTYTVRLWQMAHVRRSRGLLFSGNMASGGHALPGGLGAKFANPGEKTVVITGDGGLLSVIGELQVYAENQANVLIVVFNNQSYDSIKQWSSSYQMEIDSSIHGVDFAMIAKGFGIDSAKITNQEDLLAAIQAYSWEKPLFLELLIPSEHVECHFPRYEEPEVHGIREN